MPYIGNQPGTGVRSRFIYTATASQTTFSGADDNSKTLKYADSAYVDVFLNGICLVPGTDYTASTKTSIVLTQAASLNDTLEVVAYDIASMSDMSASNGGTFQADVTFAAGADLITASAGTDNVRLGENAGAAIASGGDQNTLIGKDAGTAITTGDRNTLVGATAGDAIVGAERNTAVGYGALHTETEGDRSTAVGVFALSTQNTTGGGNVYNTAVGYGAGNVVTTGTNNTFIGARNGDAVTTGVSNVAVGDEALGSETTANRSVAVGVGALLNQNVGSGSNAYNVAVGHAAGNQITTAAQNTIVGALAGDALTTGGLVAVGYLSGSAATSSIGNVFMGELSGTAITTGNNNTAVGSQALSTSTTGTNNAAFGHDALRNATGNNNTALGYNALVAETTGEQNVAVGYGALQSQSGNTGNTENTGCGYLAGAEITSGIGNTCIGALSGEYGGSSTGIVTGNFNTMIGVGAIASSNSGSSQIVISAPTSRTNTSGKGNSTGFINAGGGGVYQGNNASTWSQTSDRRLKKNIVDSSIGLAEINQIQVRNFEYKTKDDLSEIESDGLVEADIIDASGVQVGAIAQEIQDVLPKCVTEQSTGVLSLNTDNLTWHLIKAVQELSAKNDALEARIATLEG